MYLYIFTHFSPCSKGLLRSPLPPEQPAPAALAAVSAASASTPILPRTQQKADSYRKEKRLAQFSPVITIYRKETP